MIVFIIISLVSYLIVIGLFYYGNLRLAPFQHSKTETSIPFSIVVPFRNEAENLPALLHALTQLDYPRDRFEVLFVNDDSDDESVALIEHFPVLTFRYRILENLRQSPSPKKDAILTAIAAMQTEWLVSTDADCMVPFKWLQTLNACIQSGNMEMVAAPVAYTVKNNLLDQFQSIEMAALQATTSGSFGIRKPFMCNGANFAYTKSFFQSLAGFEGNTKNAGGDDVFLLQKAVLLNKGKVGFLMSNHATVLTKPAATWKALFSQRVRWAAKASAYTSGFARFVAVVVFMGNFSMPAAFFKLGVLSPYLWLLLVLKLGADFMLIHQSGQKINARYFIPCGLLYPFFSIAVAVRSFFPGFEWKGRRFRR